ncbi:hypothetical protein BX600DRAFT_442921 [Xylariales sp. PMI_506]|nr:hypothetical protein BX600DRAFT_442921 [Xylariales sp. PMI_506]
MPKSKTGCQTSSPRALQSAPPSPSNIPGIAGSTFTLTDLELLHHYTTSTCLSFSAEPLVRNFWRVNIPQLGFTTPYILEGILSLSALHLARSKVELRDYYIAEAFRHQTTALAMASPLIGNPTTENCEQLFLFSTMVNIFSFAKPKDPANLLVSSSHTVPEWLYLFRGVQALIDAKKAAIHRSSVAVTFQNAMKIHKDWDGKVYDNEAFRDLEANINGSRDAYTDPTMVGVLLDALVKLKKSFALALDPSQVDEHKVRGVFIWLLQIRDPYITLVSDGNNEALCVLAFFCVLLKRLNSIWWLEGWGVHLIQRLYSILDETHKLWIRWPMEEIGWVP